MFDEANHLSTLLSYDKDTGIFTWNVPNGNKAKGSIAGTVMRNGYVRIGVNGKTYMAHRLAWMFSFGKFPIVFVDHINGIRSDNRILNLREASKAENTWNSSAYSNNRLGLKGVHFNSVDRKYIAQITVGGKRKCLGSFNDKYEAYEAYIKASKALHGNFSFTKRSEQS